MSVLPRKGPRCRTCESSKMRLGRALDRELELELDRKRLRDALEEVDTGTNYPEIIARHALNFSPPPVLAEAYMELKEAARCYSNKCIQQPGGRCDVCRAKAKIKELEAT